jgi:hypothetical protein
MSNASLSPQLKFPAVMANGIRLVASSGLALVAIYWLDAGATGFFGGIAAGFCGYAALTSAAMFKVKNPRPQSKVCHGPNSREN